MIDYEILCQMGALSDFYEQNLLHAAKRSLIEKDLEETTKNHIKILLNEYYQPDPKGVCANDLLLVEMNSILGLFDQISLFLNEIGLCAESMESYIELLELAPRIVESVTIRNATFLHTNGFYQSFSRLSRLRVVSIERSVGIQTLLGTLLLMPNIKRLKIDYETLRSNFVSLCCYFKTDPELTDFAITEVTDLDVIDPGVVDELITALKHCSHLKVSIIQ